MADYLTVPANMQGVPLTYSIGNCSFIALAALALALPVTWSVGLAGVPMVHRPRPREQAATWSAEG